MTLQLSEQVEKLTKDKEQLMEEVKDLQEYLNKVLSEQGVDRIQTLKEEVKEMWIEVLPFYHLK